jgi:hypothetical protein
MRKEGHCGAMTDTRMLRRTLQQLARSFTPQPKQGNAIRKSIRDFCELRSLHCRDSRNAGGHSTQSPSQG